jgi:hypothetical protein
MTSKIKPTFVKLEIPIYDVVLFVSINQTDKQIIKECSKFFKVTPEWKEKICDPGYDGRVLSHYDSGLFVLRIHGIEDAASFYSTMSHEIFHVVVGIFDRIGATLDDSSEESYAYLIGYITKEILKNV